MQYHLLRHFLYIHTLYFYKVGKANRIMLQFSASKYAKVCDLDNIQYDSIVFKTMIDATNHT